MQWLNKHVSETELLLKTVVSTRSVQQGYKENNWATSTVTLRVIGGDEMGSLKCETVKYGHEIQGARTKKRLHSQGPAAYTYKSQTRPLARDGAPQEDDRNCHTSNKDLVVSPKWVLYTKTDWLADRRS
jgi:hypothetical protein